MAVILYIFNWKYKLNYIDAKGLSKFLCDTIKNKEVCSGPLTHTIMKIRYKAKTSKMDGRQNFLMFKEIAEIALKESGTIFGGYVRDFLKHDYAAERFYSEKHTREEYENKEVSPETLDRLLIPSDIDVHFKTHQQYKGFRSALRGSFYESTVTKIKNVYTSGPSVHHIRMRVYLGVSVSQITRELRRSHMAREILIPEIEKCLASMSTPTDFVSVDILISSVKTPPFDDSLDFACNGLVMTDDGGVGLCEELKKGLNAFGICRTIGSIMSHIRENKAVLVRLKGPRWDKMAEKGWDLVGGNIEKIHSIESETTCTLCLDMVSDSDMYKFSCCNAKYHRVCMSKIITKGVAAVTDTCRCPHCRQTIILDSSEVEIFGEIIENIF